jgi:hypothetical protein
MILKHPLHFYFLGQLTENIRGCGVSFYIWTKKGTQGELDWSSLTGSDYEKLLEKPGPNLNQTYTLRSTIMERVNEEKDI